jgi:hypothetical protein
MANTSFTSVRHEANLIQYTPLPLQLSLQFIEEAPVGALGDELLGRALDHAGLMEAQGVEQEFFGHVPWAPNRWCQP